MNLTAAAGGLAGFNALLFQNRKLGVFVFMKARVLFGVGGFIFVLLALYVLPPFVLYAAMTALCMLAAYELSAPTGLVRGKWLLALALAAALCQSLLACTGKPYQMPVILLCVLAAFAVLLREHQDIRFSDVSAALFAGLVIPYMLSALTRMFQWDGGEFLVLLPLVAAWGSDTCALFTGMALGKHKLAPVISPKKTVEGAIGGVIGATLLMLLAVYLMNRFAGLDIHYGAAALMGACGAVIGQAGDLAFSVIKRQSGIKDYGHIFPGHGGVLDRFDSVIFVAPAAELILIAAGAHI